MGNKKKIAIIGHFAENETRLDGQTIKTRVLYDELAKIAKFDIKTVDTYDRHKNPVKLIWRTFLTVVSVRDIILLVSENGMRAYFPILYMANCLFGTRTYQSVIGANLDRYVTKYRGFRKYLNSFSVNWVETASMGERMERVGVTNAEVLPNFKRLNCLETLPQMTSEKPYKLCTFSRVMKEKGIEDAISAVKAVNEAQGEIVYTLDIYGQVDAGQIQWFEDLQKTFPTYIRYGGLVPFDKSVEVLKDYFALLFPTRFYTEGVPGTIVDAYAAGLPVISAKWESFADVIEEGVTGYGYTFEDADALQQQLLRIAEKPDLVTKLKENCLKRAMEYTPETVIGVILDRIEG